MYYLRENDTICIFWSGVVYNKIKINVIAKNGTIVIVGVLLNIKNQIGGGGGYLVS